MMDGIEITAIVLDLLLIRCRILCECLEEKVDINTANQVKITSSWLILIEMTSTPLSMKLLLIDPDLYL